MRPDELRTHLHVIGKSGSGKSRFLAGLFRSLFHNGAGITLLDPHGDLAQHVLRLLIQDGVYDDPAAFERIVYLDLPEASRRGLALPFNVLKQPVSPYATASNVMDALHRYWPELSGGAAPRFDKLVQYGVKVLVSAGLSLPDLPRFLMNAEFREQLLDRERDQDIVWQWREWYRELSKQPRLVLDYIDSTHSRAALLSFHPFFKHSLRLDQLVLDFSKIMEEGRSVIVNLKLASKEEWRIIGSLLTVLAEQAALRRPSGGHVHYLMLDEFANFIEANPESLNTFLSQTRKRNVFGCFAHQNWYQTPPSLKGALQNCGIRVAFRMDYDDAVITSRILGRVDPLTVHQPAEEGSESVGMPEQWQAQVQELQDLPVRHAFIRKEERLLPWPFRQLLKQEPTRLYKTRMSSVPDAQVPPAQLREVEEEYLLRFFRPIPTDAEHQEPMRSANEPSRSTSIGRARLPHGIACPPSPSSRTRVIFPAGRRRSRRGLSDK